MMPSEHAFKDAQNMLEGARVARLEFCVFRHDGGSPGEVAGLSRLLWQHIPALAERMGVPIRQEEGHHTKGVVAIPDESLNRLIASDVVAARPVAEWLSHHVSPRTSAMFAKGADNALAPVLEAFAADRGFQRSDALSQEAGARDGVAPASHAIAAHLGSQRSMG